MKREDLVSMGLTDEQIEKVMAENGKDVQSANAKANKNNTELERLKAIEKEYEDLKGQSMSEAEKNAKALEDAQKKIAELEKTQAIASQRTSAAEKFKISAEQAKLVVKDDGSMDYDALGKIIADKETAAAQAKEKEIANGSTPPGNGGTGSSSSDTKTEAEKIAAGLIENQNRKNDILKHYI